jgi:hypothetical protein
VAFLPYYTCEPDTGDTTAAAAAAGGGGGGGGGGGKRRRRMLHLLGGADVVEVSPGLVETEEAAEQHFTEVRAAADTTQVLNHNLAIDSVTQTMPAGT